MRFQRLSRGRVATYREAEAVLEIEPAHLAVAHHVEADEGDFNDIAHQLALEHLVRDFVERPVERGLSQAALETLAIVAYLGPVSRPDIARLRGVAADSVVAGLVERGLIAEAGREDGGAVRYRATPLFERVFGLESLSELPRLDDLGADGDELRQRLEQVAGA